MRRWGILVLVAAVSVACSPSEEVPAATTTTTTTGVVTTTGAQPEAGVDPCATGDLPFVTDGLVAAIGEASGDAARISEIRWEPGTDCERVIVSFATDTGAPATSIGPSGVTAFSFAGLVRVTLPEDVTVTSVADMVTDGRLLGRTFVIRNEADAMTIDFHAAEGVPLAARAFVSSSPAALVVDFVRDQDAAAPSGAETSNTAVVVTPSAGPGLYPFIVSAYVQPGLRTVRIQLSTDGVVSIDRAISLEGSMDAWQGFESRIEDGPGGASVLFVGQVDANDRPIEGASISLDLP